MTILYVGGVGEIVQSLGGDDGSGDGGSDAAFTSGNAAHDGTRGVGEDAGGVEDGNADEDCLCKCSWHSSRGC